MYLIHAQLVSESNEELPADTPEVILRCARSADRLEHVVLHPGAAPAPGPVLGLFLLGTTLEAAEDAAALLCRRALRSRELRGFRLLTCNAVLPVAYYEQLLGRTDTGEPGPP